MVAVFLTTDNTEHTEGNRRTVMPYFRVFGVFSGCCFFNHGQHGTHGRMRVYHGWSKPGKSGRVSRSRVNHFGKCILSSEAIHLAMIAVGLSVISC